MVVAENTNHYSSFDFQPFCWKYPELDWPF